MTSETGAPSRRPPPELVGGWEAGLLALMALLYLGVSFFNPSFFFVPKLPRDVMIGFGPTLLLPTATSKEIGSGKWGAGPTAVVVWMPKPWVIGVLANNIWSYAGDDDRPGGPGADEVAGDQVAPGASEADCLPHRPIRATVDHRATRDEGARDLLQLDPPMDRVEHLASLDRHVA